MKRIRWIAAALCVLAVLCFAGTEARAEGYTLTLNLNHDGLPPDAIKTSHTLICPLPSGKGTDSRDGIATLTNMNVTRAAPTLT